MSLDLSSSSQIKLLVVVVLSQLAASPGSGVARLIFFGWHMVSPNIQELGLSDKLLEHYRKEVGEMAVGILDDKPFVSPIHEGTPTTLLRRR